MPGTKLMFNPWELCLLFKYHLRKCSSELKGVVGICHRSGQWHTSQRREPLATSAAQEAAGRTANGLAQPSPLDFVAILIFLNSWDVPPWETLHRVPVASLWAGVRDSHTLALPYSLRAAPPYHRIKGC